MKYTITLAALTFGCMGMSQAFFDDFNRPDGPLGPNYTTITGNTVVGGNAATGAVAGQGMTMLNASAFSANYADMILQADVSLLDTTSTLTYQALFIGANGITTADNGIMVKLQRQVAGGYSHIGIYTGQATNSANITTAGGNFQAFATQFAAARVTVMFTNATTLYTGIDTNFDAVDDITFNSTVNIGAMTFGNQAGIHSWGTSGQLDNFSATAVPEPATMTVLGIGALAAFARRRRKA